MIANEPESKAAIILQKNNNNKKKNCLTGMASETGPKRESAMGIMVTSKSATKSQLLSSRLQFGSEWDAFSRRLILLPARFAASTWMLMVATCSPIDDTKFIMLFGIPSPTFARKFGILRSPNRVCLVVEREKIVEILEAKLEKR
jgi:hypothetical protein